MNIAGLLGSGAGGLSSALIPAAESTLAKTGTQMLAKAGTNAITQAATKAGTQTLKNAITETAPKALYELLPSETKAIAKWNSAGDVESMLGGKYLGTNDNFFSNLNPSSLSLMDYSGRPVDQKKVAGMMRAIKNNEDIIPITAMKNNDGTISIIDGHHRMQAFRQSSKMPRIKFVRSPEEGHAYADKYMKGDFGDVIDQTAEEVNVPRGDDYVDLRGVDLSQYAPQESKTQGRSLTEMANRIKAMNASRETSTGVKKVGSAGVAKVDPNTVPAGYDDVVKYIQSNPTEMVERAIGMPLDSDGAQEAVRTFLEDAGYEVKPNFIDNVNEVRQVLSDELLDNLNLEGSPYRQFIQTRSQLQKDNPLKGVGARNFTISANDKDMLYQTDAAKLDREYSDRLGIGRSHTPMSDKVLSRDAQGYYMGGGIGVNPIHASGESGVSTIAHERMHAWQDTVSGYDSRVVNAISDLRDELKNFYHTKDQIKTYRRSGSDLDYYADPKEQEARMLQSYLDNEGYTDTYYKHDDAGTEWGNEVKPAFDKFYKKLRELSKLGVALPSIAVIFGALASGNDENATK